MADFISEYGLFLAKTLTALIAILFIMAAAFGNASKLKKEQEKGSLSITPLNDEFDRDEDAINRKVFNKERYKLLQKGKKQEEKRKMKAAKRDKSSDDEKRLYVLDFEGDMKASQVDDLRREISAVLGVAREGKDEILLRLESPGGMVHAYGLAASQLQRIRDHNIRLTISVDKVAASGGYMMACVADRIVAAPFAYIGSVGVVLQLPNFHRLLKDNRVDYEMITAGEYKRTLTLFGENTDKGREKATEEIQEVHDLFKDFIRENRPSLDVDGIASGETWFGRKAVAKGLVDEISTSDELIMNACRDTRVFAISYEHKSKLGEKLGSMMQGGIERSLDNAFFNWSQRSSKQRYYS